MPDQLTKAQEKIVEQKVKVEVEKKVEQVVEKEAEKAEKKIDKEVRKRLRDQIKDGTNRFKSEFKKQTATAITAAFAFLIALSWRTPISDAVTKITESLNLTEKLIYVEVISALIITLIAVIFLILISKWASEPAKLS